MAKRGSFAGALWLGLPRNKRLPLGLTVSALQALSAVALLATSGWLISRAAEQPPVMYLMVATVGVRAFALGRAAFRYAERILLHDAAFRMQSELRPRIFRSLVPFAPSGFGSRGYGEMVSTVVNDVDELQGLSIRVLSPIVQAVTVSIAAALFIWMLAPAAALTLIATLLGAFCLAFPVSAFISRRSDRQQAQERADLHRSAIETLDNLDVLIAFGWMEAKLQQLGELDRRISNNSLRSAWAAGIGQAMVSLLSLMATLSVALIAAERVSSGQLPGVTLAVLALLPIAVFDVVSSAQPAISAWRRYRQSADRVAEVIDREVPRELAVDGGAENSLPLQSFESLSLVAAEARYPNAKQPAFKGLSIDLEPGDRLLVQGPSGSGKTTVARVLLRFLALSGGEYLINGRQASEFSSDSIRQQIGLVEQDPTVFLGTVRANLLPAKPDATDQELEAILGRVGLTQTFAERGGLDAEVGERGLLISGGEAQRLALARALLADFKVLIFDEPTSNVDVAQATNLLAEMLSIATDAGAGASSSRAIVVIGHDMSVASLFNKHLTVGD